MINRQQT